MSLDFGAVAHAVVQDTGRVAQLLPYTVFSLRPCPGQIPCISVSEKPSLGTALLQSLSNTATVSGQHRIKHYRLTQKEPLRLLAVSNVVAARGAPVLCPGSLETFLRGKAVPFGINPTSCRLQRARNSLVGVLYYDRG